MSFVRNGCLKDVKRYEQRKYFFCTLWMSQRSLFIGISVFAEL